MDLKEIVMNIFTIVGMVVCVVVTVVALIWAICFVVKLLIKTFSIRIAASYDVISENLREKSTAKKARNKKKRDAKNARKEEWLRLKIASDERIDEMKRQKYNAKLREKESKNWKKLFGAYLDEPLVENNVQKTPIVEEDNNLVEPQQEAFEENVVNSEPEHIVEEPENIVYDNSAENILPNDEPLPEMYNNIEEVPADNTIEDNSVVEDNVMLEDNVMVEDNTLIDETFNNVDEQVLIPEEERVVGDVVFEEDIEEKPKKEQKSKRGRKPKKK